MKLSAEEAKLFFRRAQRRFKVSNDFIHRNMTAMLKFVQYAITPRIVLKRKLIRKHNRVFLHHNYLRKLIFDPTKLKKKRHAKYLHSQWSKRLVLHLKRFEVIEFVEEEETTDTAVFPEKEVSEQLKEQLELLKSGKRTVPLLEDAAGIFQQNEKSSNSERLCSNDMVPETENLETITINDETDSEETEIKMEVPLLTAVHITEEEFKSSSDVTYNNKFEKPNRNFLDMLISKVKQSADESCVTETLPVVVVENSMEPPKQTNKSFEKEAAATVNLTEERENSNSSSDFFGFEDTERVLGNFPGMLSTPLVRKRDSNSAFVSETLNAYMRDNSLENSAAVNYPQRRPEDGQVLAKSIPPKLDMPALPEGLQGLRTVAERRAFLQRTRSTKYCIINNIGTVFRELQKKSKGHRIFKQAIESVMNSSSVPMNRPGWKAAAWLLTDLGNYYFQTITVDGENFRLYGGRGNYRNKFKKPHSSRSNRVFTLCPEDCLDRITFRSLKPVRTPEKRSKLNNSSKKAICKPCPLSYKILQQPHDEESVFGSLDIVRMPQVELEVFPRLQKPLSEIAKKYLQLILPYHGITREWAEFSVSTLLERQKMELATNTHESFTFKIPYANDRNHVIIRRVYQRSEEFEEHFDNSSLSFRKEIDGKNSKGEPSDLVAVECADMLTDMLNSVAIGCSENSFIKDDPDNIYQYGGDEAMIMEKSVRKIESNQQQAGMPPKKQSQSRLLMELKRLNATVIDAAISKSEEGATACEKECCKLGCVCASLNEGTTIRKHCGKQRCVLECKCKCPSILRLENDGGKITTEDAFMLRRRATAKLARVEKEFTSTIVLTGSETLLINESQYDKKRRCTKIPKRYGDFVEHDEPDSVDVKPFSKKASSALNFPLEPVLVNDKIHRRLKHSLVKLKRLRDVQDLAPWCMIHMVYKCFCKGKATVGNPIIIEKQEELPEAAILDEPSSVIKNRTLYSFEKEECKTNEGTNSGYTSEPYESSDTNDASEGNSDINFRPVVEEQNKIEKRGRISDNHCIDVYLNAKANHCRRVVPIPRNIYQRRNKKRVAHIQLYIAENENDETRLSLNEHVLRSVYYHQDRNGIKRRLVPVIKKEEKPKLEIMIPPSRDRNRKSNPPQENKSFNEKVDDKSPVPLKKRRMSTAHGEGGSSLLRVNQYKDSPKTENPKQDYSTLLQPAKDGAANSPQKYIPASAEITIPKISQIFSLNSGIIEMGTESSSSGSQPEKQAEPKPKPGLESESVGIPMPVSMPMPDPEHQPTSAIEMSQPPSEDLASAHGVSTDAFKNVFKQVIKNMNNLVSKKMQDIDMALRRESKAIPAPNAEILCIIRWNNFLEAYLEGFVYLWEVRTINLIFIAATIKPIMPLVMNALSVVNIQAISRENLPLLGKMLIDRKRSATSEGLAVVMQGQKMYWIVKGFLRPDKTRICPKPTPDSHPLLTRKINVLCRLLINNQFNEHKKRQDALQMPSSANSPQLPVKSTNDVTEKQPAEIHTAQKGPNNTFEANTASDASSPFGPPVSIATNNISLKLKVLPMQRNISDQATTILEQMVSQAYGFVRTNLSFRKIRKNELSEIFPPAKLNSNHHWLVLDISNDFSHIFLPELKDLLTLDRIQKVMAYALAKNRIVKMQFSQKSLFNAYVTPKSQRKLYFGPYRQSITAPKLVLLQSVDGQMMLREVYESRHNINPKTYSTTAFWVVQKSGKIFLDIELDQVSPTEVDGQDTDEDNDVLEVNDCEMQQNGIAQPYQVNQHRDGEQAQVAVQQNAHFQHDSQIQQSVQAGQAREVQRNVQDPVQQGFQIQENGQVVQCIPNVQLQESGQIVQLPQRHNVQQDYPVEQRTEDHNNDEMLSIHKGQESIVLEENLLETQNIPVMENSNSDNFNNTSYIDEDDDCMIVDDEPATNTFSPVVAPASVSMPTLPTVTTTAALHQTDQDKINYTISYGGENSSLVVIQNECDRVATSMPDMVGNNFTILSSVPQLSAGAVPEITQSQNNSLQQKSQQPLPINTVFNFSSEDCRPIGLKSGNDKFKPGEIILTFPTNDVNTNVSIPAEHISNFSITPILTNPNEPKPSESPIAKLNQMVAQSESENKETNVINSCSISNFNENSIQWNKNITIKKITSDAEPLTYSRKSFPATAQKPKAGTISSTSRFSMQPQKQPQIIQSKVQQVGQVVRQQKTINPQQIIRIPNQQMNPRMNTQVIQPVQKIIVNSNQNMAQRSQSGLVVRSPSTINTIIRGQQPNFIRSAGGSTSLIRPAAPINSVLSGSRLRTPSTTSQVARLQSIAKPIIATTINSKNIAFKTAVSNKSPNLLVAKSHPNPVQSLQKDVVRRMLTTNNQTSLLQNQAKVVVNNSKPVTSPSDFSKHSQGDPLNVSEESAKTVSINLQQQPKVPNGITTVHNISQSHVVSPSPVTSVNSASGIKRNSLGTPINRTTQFRVQPMQKSLPKIISTVPRADSNVVKQNSQIKGIPIELPRLKKFAIIHTQNTTSITPPTSSSKTSGKNESEMPTPVSSLLPTSHSSANPVLRKLIEPSPIQNSPSNTTASSTLTSTITTTTTTTNTTITTTAAATKPPVLMSSLPSKTSPPGSSNANAEYGYFHSNMDGLPKFVVKRVGEDFLIKVPNFNGILKLTGLSTVHNYLNQYTTQKCGKTNEEIANLRWTFRTQDRSKLNSINKSNSSNIKCATNTPNMQKLFSLKKNSNEPTASSSTSLAPTTNKVNLQSAPTKPLEPNDSIDLSDGE